MQAKILCLGRGGGVDNVIFNLHLRVVQLVLYQKEGVVHVFLSVFYLSIHVHASGHLPILFDQPLILG